MFRTVLALIALTIALSCLGDSARADAYLYVRDGTHLNARVGPGTGYRVHRVLPPGTRLRLLARRGSWARVQTPEGLVLWVFLNYLVDRAPRRYAPPPTVYIFPWLDPPRRVRPRRPLPRWSDPYRPHPHWIPPHRHYPDHMHPGPRQPRRVQPHPHRPRQPQRRQPGRGR